MTTNEKLELLRRDLRLQGLGPLNETMNEIGSAIGKLLDAVGAALRQAVRNYPAATLWFAFQVGYMVGRSGHRHAHN
jgi:hypothetical protein